jgi:hypothetical protein
MDARGIFLRMKPPITVGYPWEPGGPTWFTLAVRAAAGRGSRIADANVLELGGNLWRVEGIFHLAPTSNARIR